MFAPGFSFWRRLMGKAEPEPEIRKDDRRFWVRYPADLESSVQLADHPGEDRIPARIRDISRGGVNLLLEENYQPGQLLSLELPCTDESDRTLQMLACVVRNIPEPNGRYSLGCVFSRELSEDDLFSFGARRVRHAPEDQRTWMRFSCQLQATYSLIGESEDVRHPAQVSNVSASGIGLDVKNSVEVGSLLNLRVTGKQGHEKTLLACVVHSVHKEDTWQLGCNFIRELSQSDFQDMM